MNNNGCLTCGAKTEPSLRNGKPKKYCSKKCAQKFYQNEGRYYKKKNKDWGTRTAEKDAAKEERRKNFEWYKKNWLTADQVGEKLGISPVAVHYRAKTTGVPSKIVAGGGPAPTAFWNPAYIDKMRNKPTPIPEGYITRKEACKILNIRFTTFQTNYNKKIKPDMIWKQTHGNKAAQHLYLKKRIEKLAFEKQEAARILKEQKEEQERREQEAKIFKKLLREQKKQEKIALKEQLKEQRRLDKLETLNKKIKKQREAVIKREDDWRHWKAKEEALFDRFDSKLEKYANDEKKYCMHLNAIQKNKQYRRLLDSGITHKFTCSHCAKEHPYYNFYYDNTYNEGRRITKCRFCITKINKKQYKSKKSVRKQRRNENYRSKFRTLIAVHIKRDVSKMRDSYAKDLSTAFIWKKINQNCGYTIDDFILALEAKFEEEMNWLNHGKGGKGDKVWQIDHIIPRSRFFFTSLDDPKFSKCWSLDNLQPLWAYDNQIKNLEEHDQFFK